MDHSGHFHAERAICRTDHQVSYLENWPLLLNSVPLASAEHMPRKERFMSLFQHSSLELSRDTVASVVGQQIGVRLGCSRRTLSLGAPVLWNARRVNSTHAPSAHYIQVRARGTSARHARAVQGKALVNLEATTGRVRLHHAMKTTAWPQLPCRKDLHQRVCSAAPG